MGGTALACVLTAGLLHAIWNVVAKHGGGDRHFALLSSLAGIVLWAPVGAWFAVPALFAWDARAWAMVLASGLAHLVYMRCLLRGYRESDLTVVYPVARGSGPLLTSVAAVAVLGERPGIGGALGLAAICGGILLVAGGPSLWRRATGESVDASSRLRAKAGIGWGVATGALIALYTMLDGFSVKVLALSPVLVDYLGTVLRVPFMLPAAFADRAGFDAAWRGQWRHALAVAAISPLAYILVLYAATMAPLSHVAPAREVSMLFVALIGGRLLGEGDRGRRVLGAVAMAAGVVLLAL